MARLWDRYCELTVGDRRWSGFAVKFSVEKSLERTPNQLALSVANLSADSLSAVRGGDEIRLDAGYQELHGLLFTGTLRAAWAVRDGAEVWLHVESEDGGAAYRLATIERSWTTEVSASEVLSTLVEALDVGRGNLDQITITGTYPDGLVLSGQAWQLMDRICRDQGLRWSIQNGGVQVRQVGQPAEVRAVRLAPDTGLLGSPKKSKPDQRTGRVTVEAKALLVPSLYPGRVVQLDSDQVEGNYLVQKVRYLGETRGADWYADLTLEEYDV